MKKSLILLLTIYLLMQELVCFAQDAIIDSLVNVTKTSRLDTVKVNAFNELFVKYEFEDGGKAKEYLDKAFELSNKINFKKGIASCYIYRGYFSEDKGDFEGALKNYMAALKVSEAMGDKIGVADAHGNIGNVYAAQSKFPMALVSFQTSLKIRESLNDRKGIAKLHNNIATIYTYQGNSAEALKSFFVCMKIYDSLGEKHVTGDAYNNIGNVYYTQNNYAEALKNYFIASAIRKALDDKRGLAMSYNNIGVVYVDQGNYSEALKNHAASLKLREGIGDKRGMGVSYNNFGLVFYAQALQEDDPAKIEQKLNEALSSFRASLKIKEEIGDNSGLASTYLNLGSVLFKQKKYTESSLVYKKAKDISEAIGYAEVIRTAYAGLASLDSVTGNYKGAYENYKNFILYRDSLDNEKTRKKTIQSQMNYDFEKKEAVASAEHKKELENQELIGNEKSRKQKIVLSLVSCFLLLVVIFAGFIFRSLRTTKKQKKIIEEQKYVVEQQKAEVELQKAIVEEHQKDIIDSITYARRIQLSLLPTDKYIEKELNRLKAG